MRQDVEQLLKDQKQIIHQRIEKRFKGEDEDFINDMLIDILGGVESALEGKYIDNKSIMQPLTPEQVEYIKLKTQFDRMFAHFRELKRTEQIAGCNLIGGEFAYPPESTIEALFLDYMKILIRQHAENQKNVKLSTILS